MAVHQKHPSIVALSTKKRVKQFKQLFNNNPKTNKLTKKGKHRSNDSILELKKRGLVNGGNKYQSQCNVVNNNKTTITNKLSNKKKKLKKHKTKKQKKKSSQSSSTKKIKGSSYSSKPSRPTPPINPIGPINPIYGTDCILSIIPQPIHCRALPTWLETSDDDQFTDYTDYTDDTDLDQQQHGINDDDDEYLEKTLAICATLTLSTSIGDSPPPNTTNHGLDSTIFVLEQSITSPANTNTNTTTLNSSSSTKRKDKFNFVEVEDTNKGIVGDGQMKETEIIRNTQNITKQLKPCKNKEIKKNITKQWEINISNNNDNNNKIKHGPTKSLLTLRNRKLVNGGLETGDNNNNDSYNDEGREEGGDLNISGDCGDNEDYDDLGDILTSDGDIQSIGRFTVISPSKKNKNNNYKFIEKENENIITTSIQSQTSVKEWKPISNATFKRTPRESLILLQKRRLVNGGLKSFDSIQEENDKQTDDDNDDEEMDIFEIDPTHRTLPTWLAVNDDEIEQIVSKCNGKKRCHLKQETDVLD